MKIQTAEPSINVGILSSNEIEFHLNGNFRLVNNNVTCSGSQKVTFNHAKIRFNCADFEELLFVPINPDAGNFDLLNVIIGKDFHWEQKENQRFTGFLKIIVEEELLTAINILPVEDYLTSVISSEMSATSSLELLKAHAVISRSWLLAQIRKSKKITKENSSSLFQSGEERICWYDREDHLRFDVCADDHCQRYQGITRANTQAVKDAVAATHGEVLTYNGEICDARFSKSCGGVSELFENCWENEPHPYLMKVIDNEFERDENAFDLTIESNAEKWIRSSHSSFCNTTDRKILVQILNSYDRETPDFYRWKIEYSQQELAALICKRSGIDFGKIIDLIPVERGVSGRLVKLKIVGTMRSLIIGKELEIRKTLSQSHLYSSAFIVEKEEIKNNIPEKFILVGAGWGHGVGLCQIGAAVMAERNYGYREILAHYYKNTELVMNYNLNESKVKQI
jgi:SpoIID/LytB domain protein